MSSSPFRDEAPQSCQIEPYDEEHLPTYLRLLDAADDGADWREATAIIFSVDVHSDEDRARRLYDTHLARARWISKAGYRDLLGKS